MQLTEILSSEHRVIERVIAAMDVAANRLEAGETLRPGFFLDAARFIRNFADGYHHSKEEGGLFEAMARNGVPTEGGPIGMMLYEHERAREYTAGLHDAARRWAAGESGAADSVARYARAYGELLTRHIAKEDNILFPLAAHAIAPREEDTVLEVFHGKEREQEGKGSKASYLDLARALCDEMGIDPEAAPRRTAEFSCHA